MKMDNFSLNLLGYPLLLYFIPYPVLKKSACESQNFLIYWSNDQNLRCSDRLE